MNSQTKTDYQLVLNRFDENTFTDSVSGKIIEPTLPLVITILEDDCVLYENDQESMVDYAPTTLGYYWIKENTCIRSRDGLVFEPSSENDAIQFSLRDGELHGEKINTCLSKEPQTLPRYSFRSLTGYKAVLHKQNNQFYLEINGKQHRLFLPEFEFSYKVS